MRKSPLSILIIEMCSQFLHLKPGASLKIFPQESFGYAIKLLLLYYQKVRNILDSCRAQAFFFLFKLRTQLNSLNFGLDREDGLHRLMIFILDCIPDKGKNEILYLSNLFCFQIQVGIGTSPCINMCARCVSVCVLDWVIVL